VTPRWRQSETAPDGELKDMALAVLRRIFGDGIPDPVAHTATRWSSERYTRGAQAFFDRPFCRETNEKKNQILQSVYEQQEAVVQTRCHAVANEGLDARRQMRGQVVSMDAFHAFSWPHAAIHFTGCAVCPHPAGQAALHVAARLADARASAAGSYSFVAPGASGKTYEQLALPVRRRVLFAGEHTSREHPDTVGGAMLTGARPPGSRTDRKVSPARQVSAFPFGQSLRLGWMSGRCTE
jgi:Flavin containing amine oxidoreductase